MARLEAVSFPSHLLDSRVLPGSRFVPRSRKTGETWGTPADCTRMVPQSVGFDLSSDAFYAGSSGRIRLSLPARNNQLTTLWGSGWICSSEHRK